MQMLEETLEVEDAKEVWKAKARASGEPATIHC